MSLQRVSERPEIRVYIKTMHTTVLSDVSSNVLAQLTILELEQRMSQLLGKERAVLVEFLRHLELFDRRRDFAELGFSSMFDYCTRRFHLPSSCAFRRIAAARLLRRFPQIAEFLVDGRLSLTTLVLLKDVLTTENVDALLARAAFGSKESVEFLVATLRPKLESRDSIRPLVMNVLMLPTIPLPLAAVAQAQNETASLPPEAVNQQVIVPPEPPIRVKANSAERSVLKMTVSRQFVADLERAKAALSHQIPDGNLEAVLAEGLRLILASQAKKHAAQTERPKQKLQAQSQLGADASVERPKTVRRYLPRSVRRAVWQRDEGRCTFCGPTGERCDSRWKLEFDHLLPICKGGQSTVDNLRLTCRTHNLLSARRELGDEVMDRFQTLGMRCGSAADHLQGGLYEGV